MWGQYEAFWLNDYDAAKSKNELEVCEKNGKEFSESELAEKFVDKLKEVSAKATLETEIEGKEKVLTYKWEISPTLIIGQIVRGGKTTYFIKNE